MASSPASIRLASVTSCSAVSSGTLPISLRYIRTGSKLPPSLCVTRAADRTAANSASAFSFSSDARVEPERARATRSVLARFGRASARRGRRGAGAAGLPARRWSSSWSSSAISSSTLMPRDSNISQSSRSSFGVGLEIGERGEDLTRRDEAALANLIEHADCGCRSAQRARSPARTRSPLRAQPSRSSSPRDSCCSANSVVHVTNCSADLSAAFQCSSALAFASASSNDLISDTRGSFVSEHRRL